MMNFFNPIMKYQKVYYFVNHEGINRKLKEYFEGITISILLNSLVVSNPKLTHLYFHSHYLKIYQFIFMSFEESKEAEQVSDMIPVGDEIEKFPEFRDNNDDTLFIDFTPDGALQKLIDLPKCQFNERITYVKHLADLLQLIGSSADEHLMLIINQIIADNDDIKRILLLQLPHVIQHLRNSPSGYQQIRDIITPGLFKLLANDNLEIKEDTGKILSEVGYYMNEADRGEFILTPVLKMAHDDLIDDNRIVGIQLLTRMADCFGQDLCDQFIGLEILSFGEDPQLRVRKESVINLPSIGRQVSADFFQNRLLPFYIKKSQDGFWGIRKASVDIIVEIAQVCSTKVKENELTEILLNCLKDQMKFVKTAAYRRLGPFIVTLEYCHPSEKLFDYYIKMTDPQINSLSNDNEIIILCAQYFPAVLKVFGEKKWPQLSKTFQILLKSSLPKVKKPIACCMHEIAQILGQEKAEKDLFPVLEQIISDASDDVKQGAISHLAEFIEVFESQKRENFVDVFLILQKDPKKWRIRELLARQIDHLARMFNPETIFLYIMPISFKLCNDTVAIVREEASKKVHTILLQLNKIVDESQEANIANIVDHIRAFSISNRYYQRQTFIAMVAPLLQHPKIFKDNFLDIYLRLAKDKVVNVRISLARTISVYINPEGPLSNHPDILQIIEVLKQDKSIDVRSCFNSSQDFFVEDLEINHKTYDTNSITGSLVPQIVQDEKETSQESNQNKREQNNSQDIESSVSA